MIRCLLNLFGALPLVLLLLVSLSTTHAEAWEMEFQPSSSDIITSRSADFLACERDPNSRECEDLTASSAAGGVAASVLQDFIQICFVCSALQAYVVGLDFNAKLLFTEISAWLLQNNFLVFIVLLYIFFQLMRLFVPLGDYGSSAPLERIAIALVLFFIASLMLAPGTRDTFFVYFLHPMMDFGFTIALNIMDEMAPVCANSGLGIAPSSEYVYNGARINATNGPRDIPLVDTEVVDKLMCFVHNAQKVAGLGIVLGYKLATALGSDEFGISLSNIFFNMDSLIRLFILFFHGVVLMVLYGLVLVSIGFILLDIFARVAIITVTAPLAIALLIIPSMRNWFGIVLKGLGSAFMSLVLAAVVLTISGAIICSIGQLAGGDGVSQILADEDLGGDWAFTVIDPMFWVLVLIPFLINKAMQIGVEVADSIIGSSSSALDKGGAGAYIDRKSKQAAAATGRATGKLAGTAGKYVLTGAAVGAMKAASGVATVGKFAVNSLRPKG